MKYFLIRFLVIYSVLFFCAQVAFSEDVATEVITLKNNLAASAIKNVLDGIKSVSGKVVFNESTGTFIVMDVPDKLKEMVDKAKSLDLPVERKVLELKNVKAADAVKLILPMLTPDIGISNIITDAEVEVIDVPEKIMSIQKAIWEMDRKKISLSVKVEAVQIILNDEHLGGIDWEAILADYNSKPFKGFGDSAKKELSFGTLCQEDFEVLTEALEAVGDMRPLVNFVKTDNPNDLEIDLNVKDLLFVPDQDTINKRNINDQVKYQINISKVLDSGSQAVIIPNYKGILGVYGVDEKVEMQVAKGSTLIIGGLFKNTIIESMRKIPLLGDIPFLGLAFRTQGHAQRKTEIVVFIKPLIKVEE
ncbi:MAG: hypothetical protein HQL25_08015 [Candidatus Omnitrophica bacterium]|nr:hypothetical protein [Candidatus Omnitrophota bacterium]